MKLVIAGRCPADVAPVFFSGRLLALNKKTWGIRPIAIGLTLRRLASKCVNSFGIKKLSPYFYPHQLGVVTPGGCEADVHSARRYIETMPQDHALVKLDFTNAFNSIHRHQMLHSMHDRILEVYAFSHSVYSQPSLLFFGPYTVYSQKGAQQGDPIGPLLWSPYVIGQTIYIFILFLSSSFFPRLISAVGDWMSTILRHMVWS